MIVPRLGSDGSGSGTAAQQPSQHGSGAETGESAEAIRFPPDANIVNVQDEPYGAKGDGVTDDTEALTRAIQDNDCATAVYRSSPKTIYLPEGAYLISDSIEADNCGVRVVGAGSGLTTIRLQDEASGFGSADDPKIVLKSGNLTSSDPSVDRNPGVDRANTGVHILEVTGEPRAIAGIP